MKSARGLTTESSSPHGPAIPSRKLAIPWRPGRFYLAVLAVFGVLYACTAQRGVAWQDSGIFQWRILNFDLFGQMGLALSHPLLIVLGKASSMLPIGPLPWRINLVSAVFGAVCVANVALLVRRLAPSVRPAAWVAAGILGLGHTFWWLSTICESQVIHAAMFTAAINVMVDLVQRPRAATAMLMGIFGGLALTAHDLALLAVPGLGMITIYLCARRRLPWRAVGLLIVGWAIGASGFLTMVAMRASHTGLADAVSSALFGDQWRSDVLVGSARAIARGCPYVLFNFPNVALPLMLAGIWALRRTIGGALTAAFAYFTLAYFIFAIRYSVADAFMFFLPFYSMVAVIAGIGLAYLVQRTGRRWLLVVAALSVLATPLLYAAAPYIWQKFALPLPARKDLAFRDAARYWLVPWKQDEDSAGQFARAALQSAPAGSAILADSTSQYPLLLVQRIDSLGPEVTVLEHCTASGAMQWEELFTVSREPAYCPRWLLERATLEKMPGGVLYRVVWRTCCQ